MRTWGRSDKWAVPGAAPIRVPGAHPTPTRTLPTAPPPSRSPTTPGTTSRCNPNNSLSELWDVGLHHFVAHRLTVYSVQNILYSVASCALVIGAAAWRRVGETRDVWIVRFWVRVSPRIFFKDPRPQSWEVGSALRSQFPSTMYRRVLTVFAYMPTRSLLVIGQVLETC